MILRSKGWVKQISEEFIKKILASSFPYRYNIKVTLIRGIS